MIQKTVRVHQNEQICTFGTLYNLCFPHSKSVKEAVPSVLGVSWEAVHATVEARKMPNPQSQFVVRNSERLVDKECVGGDTKGQLEPLASGRFSNDIRSLNTCLLFCLT